MAETTLIGSYQAGINYRAAMNPQQSINTAPNVAGMVNPQSVGSPDMGTSSFDMGSAASYIPVATTILNTYANIEDIKARNQALITSMDNKAKAVAFNQERIGEQLTELNELVGDKLTASGMEAMKAEARLKAAAAETGAAGASVESAINTAEVNKLHRDAAILREASITKKSKLNELAAVRLGFESDLSSMISGQPSATSNVLSSINSALQGTQMGLNMMSNSQREEFYGTQVT